jgi:hypothetical protein
MSAEAQVTLEAAPDSGWTYFHMTGSQEQLTASLDRLRSRGWTVSEEPPLRGASGSWDALVRPPLQPGVRRPDSAAGTALPQLRAAGGR